MQSCTGYSFAAWAGVWFALLGLPGTSVAQAEQKAQQTQPLETVEVTADQEGDRKSETAAKVFITAEEVRKFGDRTLSDILKRVPGVTVDREVRMRGLGAGYIQILIDGEPAPQGFALDSIDPDMIERIEVLRAPVVELSARTIAGTINLVLHKNSHRRLRQYKVTAERTEGSWSPAVTGQISGGTGDLSYQLAATASRQRPVASISIEDFEYDASGAQTAHRVTAEPIQAKITTLNLAPQVSWKSERDTVSWQSFLQQYKRPADWQMNETTLLGSPTEYPYSQQLNRYQDTDSVRSDLNWTHRLRERDKLETKLTYNRQARKTDFYFYGFDSDRVFQLRRNVLSDAIDNTLTSKVKYLTPIADRHVFALGWDWSYIRRSESRSEQNTSPAGDLIYLLDQQYSAQIRQLALFAQDEWSVSEKLQLYLGLRWERLKTHVAIPDLSAVDNISSVYSPVAQLLWKLPNREKDQIRVGLSRTYKAPVAADLVPRRYTADNNNSPTNPDIQGNPDLRPELAWGLDIAYESYFAKSGFFGMSAYLRDVKSVTTPVLYLDGTRWVRSTTNNGSANVYGLELELKAPVRAFFETAPDINLSLNAARNFSSVDNVQGPYNRLASQTPTSANLGFDYKPAPAFSVGMNFGYKSDTLARVTPLLTTSIGATRTLDLYSVWSVNGAMDVRLSFTNLLHQDRDDFDLYDTNGGSIFRTTSTSSSTWARLTFEHRL